MTDERVRLWEPEDGFAWAEGTMRLLGRLTGASNGTFLVEVTDEEGTARRCIHKPVAGERPLWDFPTGTLAEREVASARLSARAGFDVVPPTTLVDGPFGMGMLQQWIDADRLEQWVRIDPPGRTPPGWFAILEGVDGDDNDVVLAHADHEALRRIALFDAIINNSDRKGYHLLPVSAESGEHSMTRVWGVDHGVTWHQDDKLRTILWGWAGEPLRDDEIGLVTLADEVIDGLDDLISADEVIAAHRRCERLLEGGMPLPSDDWPSIPWPPL